MTARNNSIRLLNAVLLVQAGAFLLACLSAPHIFNGLIWLGRNVTTFEGLRDIHFEEVISRLVLIYIVVGFYPAIRWAGATSWEPFGFPRGTPWLRTVWRGWLLGIGSVGLLYVVAVASGALVWAPDPWSKVVGRLAGYLVGGLLVGLIEEILFRGAMFGLLRRVVHWIPAAVAVSIFFSLVHFIQPESPEGIVHGEWNTGLKLVPHIFFVTGRLDHYIPFALTLFVMGLVLCALYQRQGHILFIIGLHAGWVLALQTGKFFVGKGSSDWRIFFGTSENLARSWSALVLLLIILAGVCLMRPRTKSS